MKPTGREQEAERKFAPGEVIIREGDEGREMFVLQRGRVSVTVFRDGTDYELAQLERGDFFGEMSLLESLPRSATVTAVTETKVLVINPGTLLLRIRRDPTFAFELLHRMSRKLRAINEQLLDLRRDEGGLGGDDTEMLLRMTEGSLSSVPRANTEPAA